MDGHMTYSLILAINKKNETPTPNFLSRISTPGINISGNFFNINDYSQTVCFNIKNLKFQEMSGYKNRKQKIEQDKICNLATPLNRQIIYQNLC
jgi:hypothetical protein